MSETKKNYICEDCGEEYLNKSQGSVGLYCHSCGGDIIKKNKAKKQEKQK